MSHMLEVLFPVNKLILQLVLMISPGHIHIVGKSYSLVFPQTQHIITPVHHRQEWDHLSMEGTRQVSVRIFFMCCQRW